MAEIVVIAMVASLIAVVASVAAIIAAGEIERW